MPAAKASRCSPTCYYLERALSPYAEIAKGGIAQLLDKHVSVLVLADVAKIPAADIAKVKDFVSHGGVLIRFAGERMTGGSDELVPVKLRAGGRYLGSAMAWSAPQHLAPFDANSPFNGLEVPSEVTVTRQILAEPSAELPSRTWAQADRRHAADHRPGDGLGLDRAVPHRPPVPAGRRCRCRDFMWTCSSGCWRCRRARRRANWRG